MSFRPLFDLRPETDAPERGRTLSCISCGLYKDARSPRMPPFGDNRRRVAIVGESPGAVEDRRGRPWQGPTGEMVQGLVEECGLDLFRDCVSLNAVNCRPEDNETPTGHQIACCRAKIVSPAIFQHEPRVIVLMGASALASVLGPLCSSALGDPIGKWRGMCVPVPEWRAWACPTFHPSYVAREEGRGEIAIATIWRQDVRRAIGLLDEPVPAPEDLASLVDVLSDEGAILREIEAAHEAELLSHDYETTGLRASLHEVVCASFATSADHVVAFMMPRSGPVRRAWASLMSDSRVGKISHNMRFENEWTLRHFEVEEISWAWDSMVAAHVEDNRVGICSLDRQAFLRLGVRDWSGAISPYLKSIDERDPAAPNRIWEFIGTFGERDCLVYCGIDSLTAFRLAVRQMGIIRGG